jgi:hypothetical protein
MTKVIKRVRTKTEIATKGGLLTAATFLIGVGAVMLQSGDHVGGGICVVMGGIMFLARELTKKIW